MLNGVTLFLFFVACLVNVLQIISISPLQQFNNMSFGAIIVIAHKSH